MLTSNPRGCLDFLHVNIRIPGDATIQHNRFIKAKLDKEAWLIGDLMTGVLTLTGPRWSSRAPRDRNKLTRGVQMRLQECRCFGCPGFLISSQFHGVVMLMRAKLRRC